MTPAPGGPVGAPDARAAPARGAYVRPVSIRAYRLRPRCFACGRWVRMAGVIGWSHRPPRLWCGRCADRLDLERGPVA